MKKLLTTLALASAIISGAQAQSSILISEINSNGTGGDFFEIYNSGATAVNLGG